MAKIVYTANWDWVIYNFRRQIGRLVQREGHEVLAVCPWGEYVEDLQSEGFGWRSWPLERKSRNPVTEARALVRLATIYRDEAPDLVHHDTIKPNLYGPLATWLNAVAGQGEPAPVICSVMGKGFLFSDNRLASVLRLVALPVLRFAWNQDNVHVTFSNEADRKEFLSRGLVAPERSSVVISEFVDTDVFQPAFRDGEESIRVLMAARLLWAKGVGVFADAARMAAERGLDVQFVLAGDPDMGAEGHVSREKLKEWDKQGAIQWLGHVSDMPRLFRQVDVAVLPTFYNEGLPRFLVEAAASGLPLVATDMEACRQVVEDGVNGFCVPTRDSEALFESIETLIGDRQLRERMGRASRRKAVDELSFDAQIGNWMRLYGELNEKGRDIVSSSYHGAGASAQERSERE